MKRISLLVLGLCLNSGVMAATVWAPTNVNGDVNILLTTYYAGSGILALFDDQFQDFSSPGLVLSNNDTILFTPTGSAGGYTATNSASNSTFLSNSYNFILGMSLDNGVTWIADTFSIELVGANAFQVFFGPAGQTLMVDVKAVQAVPLPAAVWLFSSAILGLVGFARRKRGNGLLA